MSITLDEVKHVARLARLQLDDLEIVTLQGELNALLGHFADLRDVDTMGIDPASHAVAVQNVWSEDVSRPGLSREAALRNAPISRAGLFVVPMIIEE
jgi:aspartyl-tRNA(Asn)/glutamyl-tRNA(Gln) amidotransferase subunit C